MIYEVFRQLQIYTAGDSAKIKTLTEKEFKTLLQDSPDLNKRLLEEETVQRTEASS